MRVYDTCKDGKEYPEGRMPREGAAGGSAPEAAGEVVPEHRGGRPVRCGGTLPLPGRGAPAPHECGPCPNSGGTTDFRSP